MELFRVWRQSPTGEEAQRRLSQALKNQLASIEARLSTYMQIKRSMTAALNVSARCQGCMKKPSLEICQECPTLLADREVESLAAFF